MGPEYLRGHPQVPQRGGQGHDVVALRDVASAPRLAHRLYVEHQVLLDLLLGASGKRVFTLLEMGFLVHSESQFRKLLADVHMDWLVVKQKVLM